MKNKRWDIITQLKSKNEKLKITEIIDILLENRGLNTKKDIEEFLHPDVNAVTPHAVGIDKKELAKAIKRIQQAIAKKEQIVVFGDYDVDGICGSAILWETLNSLGAIVIPYIPHRVEEGYGLSIAGISNIKEQISNISLIITVDNGIVANKAVDFAKEQGIDVIVTDHHVPSDILPAAHAIVHTTQLCGTGVGYMLAQEIITQCHSEKQSDEESHAVSEHRKGSSRFAQNDMTSKNDRTQDHLALVALATVADLVPLTGANRALLKAGLAVLHTTKRIGLLELFKEAALDQRTIGVYEIGHIVAPRLNAMGRLEYAMDSLRLLCTLNIERARNLAQLLGQTNRERQGLTIEAAAHAKSLISPEKLDANTLLFIAHESYQQGVIGLVAGRLVEEFYRPAIVISIGQEYSKASARSIHGFNIIEFIRSASEHLVDAGGHPMAAGFTVETAKITVLQEILEKRALEMLTDDALTRIVKIDMELPLSMIDTPLYTSLAQLAPFGMGNPEPVFMSSDVILKDMRLVGAEKRHMKLVCQPEDKVCQFDAIAFGMGERSKEFHIGDRVDIAYTIDENVWNGRTSLQLKIKDMRPSKEN